MTALRRDRRAVISLELALLANFVLLPLVLGAADAGELATARSRLDEVLHQAMFYAYTGASHSVTAASVASAAAQAYGGSPAPTVNASLTQYCIVPATGYPATGTPPQPGTGGACGSGSQSVETYLVVTASVSVTLPFSVPWTAKTVTLSVSGRARIS